MFRFYLSHFTIQDFTINAGWQSNKYYLGGQFVGFVCILYAPGQNIYALPNLESMGFLQSRYLAY